MRKILSQKFWSNGTSLGSLGPLLHRDVRLGFCQHQILFIWGPCDPPKLVALQVNAKILKTLGSWCDQFVEGQYQYQYLQMAKVNTQYQYSKVLEINTQYLYSKVLEVNTQYQYLFCQKVNTNTGPKSYTSTLLPTLCY